MRLNERAMLASLKISTWSAKRVDKRISAETNERHNAAADAGKYHKALISPDALDEITRLVSEARTQHAKRTAPWSDDGARILSSAGFLDYQKEMNGIISRFEDAADRFAAAYPQYVNDARKRLNGMFNPADYPADNVIRDRFKIAINITPIPDGADFRVALSDSHVEQIRKRIEANTKSAMADAQADAWRRIADTVGHMAERLKAYNGRKEGSFRDTLVTNVQELASLLPTLNVMGDPALDQIATEMRDKLCALTAEDLRKDAGARATTARDADAILSKISAYIA